MSACACRHSRLVRILVAVAFFQSSTAFAWGPARIFEDNMVLQRDAPVSVYGPGQNGEKVTVTFGGASATAVATNGEWRAYLPSLPACKEGRDLVMVGHDRAKIVYRNVLVGDVWLCSGQSNMDPNWAGLARCCTKENLDDAQAMTDVLPLLRCVRGGRGPWGLGEKGIGGWSAPAFFFAAKLVRELGVPQGIIVEAIGGSYIEPWISEKGYRMTPGCERFITAMDAMDPKTETGKKAFADAMARIDAWQAKTMELAAKGVRNTEAVPGLPGYGQIRDFGQHYRNSISRMAHFRIRGVIWYQGESNAKDADYDVLMQALVNGWRDAWGYAFPFYYVQLAGYREVTDAPAGGAGFARVRDCQRRALKTIPNCGMACAIDVGERGNIHPRNKRDTGERLAHWALAKEFGRPVVPSGPLFRSMKREGAKIRISFDYAQGGLTAAQKDPLSFADPVPQTDKPVGGFAIAGADGVWQWADVTIDGETVIVSSPKVAEPKAVRYAYDGCPTPRANLYGKAALLPTVPFSESF